ncbi:MAG: squalene/phytoene synthase family protein, partial [Xanthobacteraceae bacterium]
MPDAFAYCAELVRGADRDRYLAALFAPAERRGALHALYAFNIEVARVRETARQPLPGEIRLQWWTDVLRGERGDEARANPVASALLASVECHCLATAKLIDL